MKKSNLVEAVLFILGGGVFLGIGLLTDSVLDSLLIGFAAGAFCSGVVMLCKYLYWNAPKNRERYQEKLMNERIELHDELKSKLRDQSARYSYTIGIVAVSVSIMIFSILGQLEIIGNSRMIVLYLAGYLVFQIALGILIFKHLLKKYE